MIAFVVPAFQSIEGAHDPSNAGWDAAQNCATMDSNGKYLSLMPGRLSTPLPKSPGGCSIATRHKFRVCPNAAHI